MAEAFEASFQTMLNLKPQEGGLALRQYAYSELFVIVRAK